MNTVNLIGRITRDPEIKYTQNGVANVGFNIAVDRSYKDAQGNKVVDFISCVAWKNQAEFISKYVVKGNLLEITGSIQTRSYQTQAGDTRVITEVLVSSVGNLTPREVQNPVPPKPVEKSKEPVYEETAQDSPDDLSAFPWY